ncbi:DNA methyltransferase [Methylobacterium sp. Leaf102]|uniref:DNA methyltransferase n=1 Tax=Methylobacterium sp. Leaf102 TaxID=1736253 RepID=UPI000ABEE3C0|nr:DNA methyltransferase [Methylobacterium sp. Leaf102]
MNHLYYGDNITIMQRMPKYSVDLIYLDPPFNSKQNYNLIYKSMTGKPVPDQADAFCDTWEMDPQKEELAKAMPMLMREHGVEDYYVEFWRLWINALRYTQRDLLAYLIYMVQRLLYMKSILRPTGSIYLHCDPTASHYIKVMMDGIFGHKNFQNEIIWQRTNAHGRAKKWGPVHDVILFYSASEKFTWNRVFQNYDASYIASHYGSKDQHGAYQLVTLDGPGVRKGSSGLPWKGIDPTLKGRHWELPPDRALPKWFKHPAGYAAMDVQERLEVLEAAEIVVWPKRGVFPRYKRYLDVAEGNSIQDVITDIPAMNSQSDERLGYPTQKPVPLLERIIKASTNKGDVVFDPFCGCGTTIYAAAKLDRKWVGCDIAILSIKLVREILAGPKFRLVEGHDFDVDGIPVSVEQAEHLFKRDPFQFEHWLVERVGGFPTKKTGDKGIDGRMYFETKDGLKAMVLSVKGGKLKPGDVRDLRGVLADQQDTEMAGFLSLQEPSKAMREAASLAGQFEYGGVMYDRLQFLTVKDILEDKREFHTPTKMVSRISSAQGSLAL